MASNIMEANGNMEEVPATEIDDVKIIVVGEEKCGKTKFIEAFAEREGNKSGDPYPTEYARVYQCKYDIKDKARDIKIFEILGGPDNLRNFVSKDHFDANGIVLMYAIDNPLSFQQVVPKWYDTLKGNCCWRYQPSILVGNKRDLRENQQVITSLAQKNQAPVTYKEGKELAELKDIKKFYECSSIDQNDRYIHDAFHYILVQAVTDWKSNWF